MLPLTFSSFQIRKYTAPSICISHINHYTRVNNVHNSSLVFKHSFKLRLNVIRVKVLGNNFKYAHKSTARDSALNYYHVKVEIFHSSKSINSAARFNLYCRLRRYYSTVARIHANGINTQSSQIQLGPFYASLDNIMGKSRPSFPLFNYFPGFGTRWYRMSTITDYIFPVNN